MPVGDRRRARGPGGPRQATFAVSTHTAVCLVQRGRRPEHGGRVVAAGPLGLVDRGIGDLHQLDAVVGVVGEGRHAGAQRHLGALAGGADELAGHDPDAVGHRHHLGGRAVRQQHDELLAADAGDDVDRAGMEAEGFADAAEDLVALAVPVRVVDQLEVVDVEEHQAQGLAGPAGAPGDLTLEGLVERPPVGQSISA